MGEKVTIPVEFDVDDVRQYQTDTSYTAEEYDQYANSARAAALRVDFTARAAALRFKLPWEPSEELVDRWLNIFFPDALAEQPDYRAAAVRKLKRAHDFGLLPDA